MAHTGLSVNNLLLPRPDLLLPQQGPPRREEMSTIPVKNTLLHLNGQNLALASKNGVHSRAPGPHLSPVRGKEAPRLTQEGTVDSLLQPSQRPVLDKTSKNHPARRPLKLAPLVLSEHVSQNFKCSRDVAKCAKEKTSLVELKKPPKQIQSMDDVVCKGIPAPLFPKITPNSPQKVSAIPKQTEKRRLTRKQCLEANELTTLALSSEKDQRVKGQLQDRAHRGNPQSVKGIRGFRWSLQRARRRRVVVKTDCPGRVKMCRNHPEVNLRGKGRFCQIGKEEGLDDKKAQQNGDFGETTALIGLVQHGAKAAYRHTRSKQG
ncbi:hypothetical protein WMY93_019652 [Mugilogobius chulae]|uniref:Uncharacterized protein n=1 Tax=Mugilogobius chulae TaxID=88201 RepID=A0AAW0NJ12_9GOBI